jgi:hypothetical protein
MGNNDIDIELYFEGKGFRSLRERVTSLLVQRSNQETPFKEHDFVATKISEKDCRGLQTRGHETNRYQVTRPSN